VLRRVRAALAPGGVFVMVDAKFSSHLAGNAGNPLAALCYAISLMYCTPVGLDGGGAGLGAMWGTSEPARCSPRRDSAGSRCWTRPGRRTASSPAGPESRKLLTPEILMTETLITGTTGRKWVACRGPGW
jgi:hypothetical protein